MMMIKIMIIVCLFIWNLNALKWKHEQQEGESEHHKMGGRSASGLMSRIGGDVEGCGWLMMVNNRMMMMMMLIVGHHKLMMMMI